MDKTFFMPIIFSISLILITEGFAAEEKPNTFGLKTGKELFNAKDGPLPEIRIAVAIDKIGLEVQISPEAKNENALHVNSVSTFDRGGEFFNRSNLWDCCSKMFQYLHALTILYSDVTCICCFLMN